jgi:hypothetical protein
MSARKLPVRPDLDQLKHQAKDLLRDMRRGESSAAVELQNHHPERIEPGSAKLAHAQLVLARRYGIPSWPRLVLACRVIDAIWRDDVAALRRLVQKHPQLLHEMASGTEKHNWGPPMTYAANLGRDEIISMLHELGATDHLWALGRAALQSKIGTARMLHAMMGSPRPPAGALVGPAYTLSVSGTALMFEFGAQVHDADGKRIAPVDMVLETDSRNPSARHQILDMYVRHGLELPDTPTMALHQGRIDLLEEHLLRDPGLLRRTFIHDEIYLRDVGCHDGWPVHGTPLEGATLLHLCVEFDELEIARWLLERGMDVDAKAAVDADGFGGHSALFGAVVSYPNWWKNYGGKPDDASFARLLLDHGADPNARASLRKQLGDGPMKEYREVTPFSWGEQFRDPLYVSKPAMQLIAERSGHA